MQITEKTGPLVAVTNVTEDHDLMIITRSGITIRMKVADLRVLGRATQGVKLIDLRGKNFIASITKVPTENEEEQAEQEGTQEVQGVQEGEGSEENLSSESNFSEEGDTKE